MDATGPLLGRLDSTWTLGRHTRIGDGRALTRTVAGCSNCRLLEETTFGFYIKDEAHMDVVAGSKSVMWMYVWGEDADKIAAGRDCSPTLSVAAESGVAFTR